MLAYVVRRMLAMPVLIAAIAAVTLALGLYGPGNPVEVLLQTRTRPEVVQRISDQWGLDRPFPEQLGRYLLGVVQGDFGESYKYREVLVTDLILPRIWVSTQLAAAASVISLSLGIALGIIAAYRQGHWVDRAIIAGALVFVSVPSFVAAPIVSFIFSRELRWLPIAGWDGLLSTKAILPVLILALPGIAGIARQMRASTLDVLAEDYVRTAQAKGLHSRTVSVRHVARNAMLPIITIIGFALAELPSGALIVESWYGIPGVGKLAFDSIFARDYPIIMAVALIVAAAYVIGNLAADLLYAYVDPRIRYG